MSPNVIQHRLKLAHVQGYPLTWSEREELKATYNGYLEAYATFVRDNTDDTMINLIGTYARWSRVMHTLSDKYGG